MLHTWLSHLDSHNKHIRICFLDFSKAFDRIGYNILIDKLIELGVRSSLIPWIINFLTDRKQRVKIGPAISDWMPVTAGVPQGTKLGPVLFIVMVNDLKIISNNEKIWKFVDDNTVSEQLTASESSEIQLTLNSIETWSSNNWMILNPKKCKELRICFLKGTLDLQPLRITECELENVQSHKVLSLTIQHNLKWDIHIRSIIAKGSKRLHILRILKLSGVITTDLVKIYIALIRSILEYCCEVWSNSLPKYHSDELERLQKRVMRIIFPEFSYEEALVLSGCRRLDDRRNSICEKTLSKIIKHGPLQEHLPQSRSNIHYYNTRNANELSLYKCRTTRFKNSFFPIHCLKQLIIISFYNN